MNSVNSENSTLHDVTPDPERITESLRDTGYSLATAVADIVDNSIAARATEIEIELDLNPRGELRFSVADNGIGMDSKGLVNALKYGSERRADLASLGKFGLGLKTASTAFARRLKVTSKQTSTTHAVTAVWDLDSVAKNGWKVEELATADSFDGRLLERVSNGGSGTVVRWEKADRVLPREYAAPTGTAAQKAVDRIETTLREHLGTVFQRFLDPNDDRSPNVTIALRNREVKAWDPFSYGARMLVDRTLKVVTGLDQTAQMQLRVFVLPPRASIQDELGPEVAELARVGNKTQGIYVYRENRLIHGPDWLGLWVQEPHGSLCRAELSFGHELDEAFQIDIKKSEIVPDLALLEKIEELISGPRREADANYRNGKRKSAAAVDAPMHGPSNATIGERSTEIPAPDLVSVDKTAGKATITNAHGPVTVTYVDSEDKRVFVESVEDLPSGLLYMPAYIGKNLGVQINRSHPYYEKVYLPSRTTGTTIQALDSLLWALASAEFRSTQDSAKRMFEDLRYDVSRALSHLVESLPEYDDAE
ncbi:MAG: ATP-binding protein [Salinibacterium amurskyense]